MDEQGMEATQQGETDTQKQNPLMMVGVIAAVVIIGGVGYMLTRGSQAPATEPAATVAEEAKATETPAAEATSGGDMASDVQIVDVEAGSFYYKPNEIRVKKGAKVKIVMKSVSMMHDFVIDELNVKMPVAKSGETGAVEFTADKVGTFEYYCSVGQHRKNGQIGKLIVE